MVRLTIRPRLIVTYLLSFRSSHSSHVVSLVAIDPSGRRGPTSARPPAEFSREIHGLLMGRLLLGPETRGTKVRSRVGRGLTASAPRREARARGPPTTGRMLDCAWGPLTPFSR